MNHLVAIDHMSPGKDLEGYIIHVNSVPFLSEDEERQLAQRFRNDGDLAAAHQLVISHLRFVVHLARGYTGYGLPQADLIQEGNIGLMKAIKRFDPGVGVRLASFAIHWIKAEIHEFILRNWRIVKIATTKAQRKLFFNLRSAKKRLGWLNRKEAEKISADLGVHADTVREMEARMSVKDSTFDAPAESQDDDTSLSPSQYLEASDADPAIRTMESDHQTHRRIQLARALDCLDERSRDIIRSRWLNEENKSTLQELAHTYKVSAERIRQLERNALKKLQSFILSED